MERSLIPALGQSAFQLDAHWLLEQAGFAPDEEAREAVEAFAHDLATIQNLPTSRDIPEQLTKPSSVPSFFRDLQALTRGIDRTPPEKENTDGQD